MMNGATMTMAMFPMKYRQSVANVLAGMAMKVSALSCVPKMLMPAAPQGMRPPALKKSSVVFSRREKYTPIATRASRYTPRTE